MEVQAEAASPSPRKVLLEKPTLEKLNRVEELVRKLESPVPPAR